ncbi:MAG: hypothetical protein QNK68_06285 [Flavobacteriales bacterium]
MRIIKMTNENTFYFLPTISYFWDGEYKAIDFIWLSWTFELVLKDYE